MSATPLGSNDDDDDLISRYLDGTLDVSELAAFNRHIVNNPAFAARLYKIAHLHGSLRELGNAGTESLFSGSPMEGAVDLPVVIPLPTPGASEVSRPRGKRSVGSALMVAALFLVATVGVLYVVWPKNAATLAILKQGRNVWIERDGNQIPVTGETEIHAGDSIRTAKNGSATLVFNDANLKVDLEGESHLALPDVAAKPETLNLALEQGVLSASMENAKPAHPVVIATPTGEVSLHTTQLTVAASPTETRLDVHAGSVQLARKSDGKTVAVANGQYAIAGNAVEMAALPFATPAREKEEPDVAVAPRVIEEPKKKEEPLKPWEMNITGFRVVNAETGEPVPELTPLFYGSVLEKKKLPKGFTVEALTSPDQVGSIVFELNGRQRVFVANKPPYTISAVKGAGFENLDLSPGMYNLRATPYTKPDGKGKPGPYMVVRFQVVRQKGKPQGPPAIPPPKQ